MALTPGAKLGLYEIQSPLVSPNGNRAAFVAVNAEGKATLWVAGKVRVSLPAQTIVAYSVR